MIIHFICELFLSYATSHRHEKRAPWSHKYWWKQDKEQLNYLPVYTCRQRNLHLVGNVCLWLPDGSDLRFSLYAASNNFRMNPCGCGSGFGSRMKSAPWKRGQTHSSACLTVLQIGSCLCWRYLITSSKKKKMQLFSFLFFFFRPLQKRKTSDRLTQTLPQTPTEVSDLWTRCQTDRITSERFSVRGRFKKLVFAAEATENIFAVGHAAPSPSCCLEHIECL